MVSYVPNTSRRVLRILVVFSFLGSLCSADVVPVWPSRPDQTRWGGDGAGLEWMGRGDKAGPAWTRWEGGPDRSDIRGAEAYKKKNKIPRTILEVFRT